MFFILLFCSLTAHAQPDSGFSLNLAVKGDIVDFSVDNLGNIYLINSGNGLKKVSARGDSLAVYNDVKRYGRIYSMDVTNPLKILLFYREFATIVMLDRFLNIVNTIDLRKLNIFQAKAIGLAYDNNVWVYDELEGKIKKIADDGSLVDASTDIRQFADPVPEPDIIADQSGLVYLYDSARGAYIFDYYGAFQKHIPLIGWLDFNVIEKNLLGRNQQYFFRYQLNDPEVQRRTIPPAYLPSLKIIIMPSTVYTLKQGGLEIYSQNK